MSGPAGRYTTADFLEQRQVGDAEVVDSCGADASEVSHLLPPPAEVVHFLDGGQSWDFSATAHTSNRLHHIGVPAGQSPFYDNLLVYSTRL